MYVCDACVRDGQCIAYTDSNHNMHGDTLTTTCMYMVTHA